MIVGATDTVVGGSPAYAGIDPIWRAACAAASGFPRIRGDRPPPPPSGWLVPEVPPHTRG